MNKLLWIRRRARRIMNFYGLTIRLAVAEAATDWRHLNPGK